LRHPANLAPSIAKCKYVTRDDTITDEAV